MIATQESTDSAESGRFADLIRQNGLYILGGLLLVAIIIIVILASVKGKKKQ